MKNEKRDKNTGCLKGYGEHQFCVVNTHRNNIITCINCGDETPKKPLELVKEILKEKHIDDGWSWGYEQRAEFAENKLQRIKQLLGVN